MLVLKEKVSAFISPQKARLKEQMLALNMASLSAVEKSRECGQTGHVLDEIKNDRNSSGGPKPIRPYWRGTALEYRSFFISPRSGVVILAHGFDILSPKPDGLVHENAFALNQNPSRRAPVQFVHTP